MKKFIVVVFALMVSISSFANNETPVSENVKNEIRTQVVKLLKDSKFVLENEVKTTVELIINRKGELVILNIDCTNPTVCSYLKNKLNYKKVVSKKYPFGKIYKMPLRILKS